MVGDTNYKNPVGTLQQVGAAHRADLSEGQ